MSLDAVKSEASTLPANLMRTMPYTCYVAVAGYSVTFASPAAAWLALGLVAGDVLNAVAKWVLKKAAGAESSLLRRPEGAVDSGVYPQHYPQPSTTSGMPSGHAQFGAFFAVVLSHLVASPDAVGGEAAWERALAAPDVCLRLAFVWLIAGILMASRTRFGGPLSVRVDGQVVGHHTVLQVLVGAAFGGLLGQAAIDWYAGQDFWWSLSAALVVLSLVAFWAAVAESSRAPACGYNCAKGADSGTDWSTDSGGNDAWTGAGSPASDPDLRSRPSGWSSVGSSAVGSPNGDAY